jgi:hypothetical protein
VQTCKRSSGSGSPQTCSRSSGIGSISPQTCSRSSGSNRSQNSSGSERSKQDQTLAEENKKLFQRTQILERENLLLKQEKQLRPEPVGQSCGDCTVLYKSKRVRDTDRRGNLKKLSKRDQRNKMKDSDMLATMASLPLCTWSKKYQTVCCKRGCSQDYTPQHVKRIRLACRGNTNDNQRAWIWNRMEVIGSNPNKGARNLGYLLEQPNKVMEMTGEVSALATPKMQNVCQRFFLFSISRSLNFLPKKVKGTVEYKDTTYAGKPRARVTPQAIMVKAWIVEQEKYALIMPKPEGPAEKTVVLPYMTKQRAYKTFCLDLQTDYHELGLSIPSRATFLRTWSTDPDLKHIKTRRWIPFAKCSQCSTLQRDRHKNKDTMEKNRLDKQLRAHLQVVQRERNSYYTKRKLAVRFPEKYMSMIVDGADQGEYALPYTNVKSKASQACPGIQLKLMGVLVHGIGVYAYTVVPNCKQGVNATCESIQRTLVKMIHSGIKLPPKLYLQLDNTAKQCKSRFLFAYLGLLVRYGVFQKIVVSFLPVGHTHEDIDQVFSRFAVALRQVNVWNRQELAELLADAYHYLNMPTTMDHIEACANISEWAELLVPESQWAGISQYHQFRVWRKGHGVAVNCRLWCGSTQEAWQGILPSTNWTKIFQETDTFQIPNCPVDLFTSAIFPAAQRTIYPKRELDDIADGIVKMEDDYSRYARDCRDMLHLMSDLSDVEFHWTREDVVL